MPQGGRQAGHGWGMYTRRQKKACTFRVGQDKYWGTRTANFRLDFYIKIKLSSGKTKFKTRQRDFLIKIKLFSGIKKI